jgi:aspartyl protease family protein
MLRSIKMSVVSALGYVRVKGLIGRRRGEAEEVEFLVDTGSFYTVIPPALAEELKIKAVERAELILADKRRVEAGITVAYMKLLDRDGVLPVAIMDSPEPLLGATALEGLGLRVDPATGKLEHSRPYGLAAI